VGRAPPSTPRSPPPKASPSAAAHGRKPAAEFPPDLLLHPLRPRSPPGTPTQAAPEAPASRSSPAQPMLSVSWTIGSSD
jgi:hypothetical protein